jgi:hypothetical protein
MPATFDFESDHGAATGSPAQGTTRATGRTDCNWKNVDDATSAYSSFPVTAGNNSYEIFLFGKFSGSFTTIAAGLFAHITTGFGTGITLKGTTTSTYTTPSTAANSALTTNMTSAIAISSGLTVNYSGTGPQGASPTSTCSSNPCYTQYCPTQIQTTGSAAAGDSATVTLEIQYQES